MNQSSSIAGTFLQAMEVPWKSRIFGISLRSTIPWFPIWQIVIFYVIDRTFPKFFEDSIYSVLKSGGFTPYSENVMVVLIAAGFLLYLFSLLLFEIKFKHEAVRGILDELSLVPNTDSVKLGIVWCPGLSVYLFMTVLAQVVTFGVLDERFGEGGVLAGLLVLLCFPCATYYIGKVMMISSPISRFMSLCLFLLSLAVIVPVIAHFLLTMP